jgi:hypothetical protein
MKRKVMEKGPHVRRRGLPYEKNKCRWDTANIHSVISTPKEVADHYLKAHSKVLQFYKVPGCTLYSLNQTKLDDHIRRIHQHNNVLRCHVGGGGRGSQDRALKARIGGLLQSGL